MKAPFGDRLSRHHPKLLQGLDEGNQRDLKGRLGLEQTAVSCPVWGAGVSMRIRRSPRVRAPDSLREPRALSKCLRGVHREGVTDR